MNQAHKSPCLCVFVYVSWYTPLSFFLLLWPYVSVTLVCLWPKYLKEANVKDKTCILAHGFSKGSQMVTWFHISGLCCNRMSELWERMEESPTSCPKGSWIEQQQERTKYNLKNVSSHPPLELPPSQQCLLIMTHQHMNPFIKIALRSQSPPKGPSHKNKSSTCELVWDTACSNNSTNTVCPQ